MPEPAHPGISEVAYDLVIALATSEIGHPEAAARLAGWTKPDTTPPRDAPEFRLDG